MQLAEVTRCHAPIRTGSMERWDGGDCRYCNCTAAKISRSVTAQIQLLCNLSTIPCKASSVHSGFSASQCC